MAWRSREIELAARPEALPGPEHFRLVERDVSDPRDGELVVRTSFLSVDPFLRHFMSERPAVGRRDPRLHPLNAVVPGAAVGRVVASRTPAWNEGDWVVGRIGWREYAPTDGSGLRRVDPARGPVSLALGALGMPGFTAWIGTELLARPESGETMFVSSAAGAVGSLAGQLARLRGARVVGSTGSVDKVAWLVELGFDEAFNYRDGDILVQLRSHAPEGLHVFFDNVGGDHLRAALESLRDFGRIIICGAIASYNMPVAPPGPHNLELIFLKALTVRGFRNYDFREHHERFLDEMSALIKAGRVLAGLSGFRG
jgi:NADPH-dependent curcumin reductase CurA